MALRLILFFTITCTTWVLAHYYVGARLIRPLRSEKRKRAARIALWSTFLLAPTVMFLGRDLTAAEWFAPIRWLAFAHMGFFFLLFVGVVLRDVAMLLTRGVRKLTKAEPLDPERRAFFVQSANAGVVGGAAALTGWGMVDALREPELVEVDVPIEGLPEALDGYRIAQISDVHIGPSLKVDFMRSVVAKVNSLDADLVAVTGDLVDGWVDDLRDHVAPLGEIRGRDGAFFCTGNHEYYWDADAWVDEVRRLGLTPLLEEHRVVERDGAKMVVAGCTDIRTSEAHDPKRALEGAPEHDFSLLLAHQPKSIYEAAEAGFDLQISGHTHGGQFFPVTLFVGLAQPFVKGLGKHEDTWIYVNRGTGWWGPPMRTGVPGEITLLRLVRA